MKGVQRARLAAVAGTTIVIAAWCGVQAHEPGSTRVDIEIAADGMTTIVMPVDAVAVWRHDELAAGRIPAAPPTMAELRSQAGAYADTVRRAIDLGADGASLPLAFEASDWSDQLGAGSPGSRVSLVVMTFTSRVPTGTRALTWRYDLPVGAYPLRVLQPGRADPHVTWVVGARGTAPVPLAGVGTLALARSYTWLGLVHIVPRGLDHILFVLSLFLLAPRWRALLAQVSAFTLAHTVTLGATMIGWISLPALLVEPLIAVSIAWVALENIWRPELSRSRMAVVFLFGLLHGAGFAGVLGELGLPAGARILALLAFNIGVEAGQALVLLAAFACTAVLLRRPRSYRRWVVVPASFVIALVGLYWTVERVWSLHPG